MTIKIGEICKFEAGEMEENEMLDFFQSLIDSGDVWGLQGIYGRTAATLIEAGYCIDTHNILGEKEA